ncbi:hypothetical protein DFH29DRAFT_1011178 [Suillus ampliporus]|nr:hypothetical protein DFH29DRAFT_1011178 [Suillus ampliporus]
MPRKMFPLPTGGHESLLCDNYPDLPVVKLGKPFVSKDQYSREQRIVPVFLPVDVLIMGAA